ncbi:NAD(+) diphosphatase [Clostridium manihotivorum]|uniref:NAD(+) diphosphatase n=1 Tax=Clostridium manihotivorum TaxID=2320868 RepID=A0A410DYU3_9CLOT|nr:NAD(+) diphosphatase [Clostridium manihotivorum]QAA34234.1 NAD(+) diphosphatase [Clostridium manihotivorum]
MDNKFEILSDVTREYSEDDLGFVIFKGNILVKKTSNSSSIPSMREIIEVNLNKNDKFFIGKIGDKACFAMDCDSEPRMPENFQLISLRDFAINSEEYLFLAAGRANQILHWNNTHKFCGSCGTKTENKVDELAKVCPSCSNVMYPVICPAIIVAVKRDDKILLAHNANFKNNMYSLIAGFVEAGEELERTVEREVFEEVGIKIKNIRYHHSSPWSFPNSLMLGFVADYESGDIKVDGKEILHADWFDIDNFPNIPEKFTLARKLIDAVMNI